MALAGWAGGNRSDFNTYRAQKRLQTLCIQILHYASDDVRTAIYEQLRSVTNESHDYARKFPDK